MDIVKLEKLLNGACIVLIAVTSIWIAVKLIEAYSMIERGEKYGCTAGQVIEGDCKLISSEPVKRDNNKSPG